MACAAEDKHVRISTELESEHNRRFQLWMLRGRTQNNASTSILKELNTTTKLFISALFTMYMLISNTIIYFVFLSHSVKNYLSHYSPSLNMVLLHLLYPDFFWFHSNKLFSHSSIIQRIGCCFEQQLNGPIYMNE